MYLAIDFGGTNIKTGVFSDGELTMFLSIPSHSDQGIARALERVKEALEERGIRDSEIKKAGIAIPGIVDPVRKRLLSVNHKFDDAVAFHFEAWFREYYHCPLVMENDANAALYGEITGGCATGVKNAVLMTLGTGIGTAVVLDGHLLRGAHYQAGILGGHLIVDLDGKACSCGGKGCLETLAGSRELEQEIPLMEGYRGSVLAAEGQSDIKSLIDGVRAEDAFCKKVFEQMMDIYGMGVTNLIRAYDPATVILSGGVMQSADVIVPALKRRVDHGPWMPWGKVDWRVAKNPDRSVLLGLYAWMKAE